MFVGSANGHADAEWALRRDSTVSTCGVLTSRSDRSKHQGGSAIFLRARSTPRE